jgi:hypothetical protein
MTSVGIARVGVDDAGAASGLVNTFHQVGMALGLGVLVAASAHAGQGLTTPAAVLTARVSTALTAGSVLLTLCLIATLALILGGSGITWKNSHSQTGVRAGYLKTAAMSRGFTMMKEESDASSFYVRCGRRPGGGGRRPEAGAADGRSGADRARLRVRQ